VRDTGHARAAAALAPELPHARVQVIDDAGHLANLDQPEAYTEAVRGFAGEVAR
jgi:pimeloyl-ACP methyl ester carboxylesterase